MQDHENFAREHN